MKKNVKLIGLDCANCAGKMEEGIGKLKNVISCKVNFMAQRMVLEVEDGTYDEVMKAAEKIIHGLEPDVEIKA